MAWTIFRKMSIFLVYLNAIYASLLPNETAFIPDLDELLESTVNGGTKVWNTLVEVDSGDGTLRNAFRGEFKLL
jgi:hypothetical protein